MVYGLPKNPKPIPERVWMGGDLRLELGLYLIGLPYHLRPGADCDSTQVLGACKGVSVRRQRTVSVVDKDL